MKKILSFLCVALWALPVGSILAADDVQPTASDPDDVYWGTAAATFGSGLNGPVNALAVYEGKLIAAGEFTMAGGAPANHIAAWDGATWSSLGNGIANTRPALITYRSWLVATDTGATVVAWDGTKWTPFGSGPETSPAWWCSRWQVAGALAVKNDTLLCAWNSHCTDEGFNKYFGSLGSWDGASWSWHSLGWDSAVHPMGLAVFRDQVVTSPLGVFCCGASDCGWDRSGGALAVWNDKLCEVHRYTFSGNMCAWGGSTWVSSWDGTSDVTIMERSVYDSGFAFNDCAFNILAEYDGKLILGGRFDTGNIATWDGTAWWEMGSGLDSAVKALAVYENKLVVGGSFTTAGGKASLYLAAWTTPPCFAVVKRGDISCDGVVCLDDLVALGNYLDGLLDSANVCSMECAGDVDKDGDIDEDDYNQLYDMVAGVGR